MRHTAPACRCGTTPARCSAGEGGKGTLDTSNGWPLWSTAPPPDATACAAPPQPAVAVPPPLNAVLGRPHDTVFQYLTHQMDGRCGVRLLHPTPSRVPRRPNLPLRYNSRSMQCWDTRGAHPSRSVQRLVLHKHNHPLGACSPPYIYIYIYIYI